MFHRAGHHSSEVTIQGQRIYVPEAGWIYDRFRGQGWKVTAIENWGTDKKEDQYWRRLPMPEWYKQRRKEEARIQKQQPNYLDEECEDFRLSEWEKRLNGFWFYNNGIPTYLTGLNWYYLQHVWINAEVNNGYPLFTIPDQEIFYLLQFCRDDPNTLGLDLIAGRRKGKTAKAIAFLLERVTRIPNCRAGIQSKTDDDAKLVVYQDGVWESFKRLPHYFRPEYKKARGSNIPPELVFRSDSTSVDEFESDDGLSSTLDYRASPAMAYDGAKLIDYLGDEERKAFHVDVEERRRVVKKCLTDFNGEWSGCYFGCTTVELIDGRPDHTARVIQMWKDSDTTLRDPDTGKTVSGLIHYFLSGDRGRNFDVYGYPDVERNRQIILSERPDPNKGLQAYYSEVRKDPLDISECFRSVSKECHFNALKINQRLDELTWQTDIKIRRGLLRWKDNLRPGKQDDGSFNRNASVEFVDDPSGPVYVWRLPPEDKMNNVVWKGNIPVPQNKRLFSMGVDPYDHDTVKEGAKSMGAAWLFGRRFLGDPDLENRFLMFYYDRPAKSSILYENCWKLAWLAGTDFLYESNRDKIKGYFEYHGMLSFLEILPGRKEPGIASSVRAKVDMVEALADYVTDHCDLINFTQLLEDMLPFDINDTRKSDPTMSAGWTLISDLFHLYARVNSDHAAKERKVYFRRYKTTYGHALKVRNINKPGDQEAVW